MSALSIYIPSVYPNITEHMISETFNRMDVGKVKHVELISKQDRDGNTVSKKAYVFFESLYQSDLALDIHNKVSKGNTVKLAYGKSEHVFWILLNCKREYDGKSNVGEYVEPDFTKEELDFMEQVLDEQQQGEDLSLVSCDYANLLEHEIHNLRTLNVQMQYNYMTALNSHTYLLDKVAKWTKLGLDNQGDRLCNIIRREHNIEEGEEVEN